MLGLIVFLLGVMVSIAVHELGHLLAAKRSGARVSEFMVGFGPRLISFKRGSTRYGLKLLPFGGYVRILGMHAPGRGFDRPETDEEREIPGTDFWRLGTFRRSVTLLAGVTANFLLAALLLLVVLLGIGLPTPSTTVEAVSPCVAAAPCSTDEPASPAYEAGLQSGDVVLSVDDVAVPSWDAMLAVLAEHQPGDRIVLLLLRGDRRIDVPVVLGEHPVVPGRAYIGVTPTVVFQSGSATAVPALLWDQTYQSAAMVAGFPARVFSAFSSSLAGEERDPSDAISIVGAGRLGAEIGSGTDPLRSRLGQLLALLAGLNISLAVFNLIPLVPLDGGHVAVVWFEGLRARLARLRRRPDPGPVDYRRLMPLTQFVVVFFITASLLLIFADIANPVSMP